MKRFLQLLGELSHYRLSQAKLALQELADDDELVIVVPEQALAAEIQQWATSQGFTVAAPKKILDGLARWQLSVKKAVPAPAAEDKPATATPAPAAAPTPAATPIPPAAPAPAAAAPAASGAPTPVAASTAPATPAPIAAPVSAAGPTD